MRVNRSKTGKRRSQHGLTGTRTAKCECGALRIPHRACPSCGKYNGKIIVDVVERAKREARRTKRREKALRAAGERTESQKEETPSTT
jgi:large subunit ribosomal protein L32